MVQSLMMLDATTWARTCWALFLDVDGTLLEIAETPASVRVSNRLKTLLIRLVINLEGAVALVSGRRLEDVDRLFAPLRLCVSGTHGCERRRGSGARSQASLDPRLLDGARGELTAFVAQRPGLLFEDKGYALAVHFRRVPHMSPEVYDAMTAVRRQLGTAFALQPGKCVFELRPAAWSKGIAIAQFMTEAPFAGRTPLYIGDDLTDEPGFAVVNTLGGLSVRVGEPANTLAQHRVGCVSDLIEWLESAPGAARSVR